MAFGVLHRFACDIGPFLTPLCKFDAMARGRGLPLPTVFTLHSAFIDPTTPPGAPGRESIEVRLVAIW